MMKKALLILILFAVFTITNESFAVKFKWHFGAKVGMGFTGADVSDNTSSTSNGIFNKESPAGGIFFNVSHKKYVRIQIEAMYLKKGFNRNGFTADLDYLSFPFLVRFQHPVGFFFNAGIGITTLLEGTVIENGVQTNNARDYFEPLEYDVQGGIGWEFKISDDAGSILLEYRLTYSLSNISQSSRYPESINHITNHVYIGYQY